MTRTEIIAFLKANPGVKVTHKTFAPNEFLYSLSNGHIIDEEDYLFEDWSLDRIHCGMRSRTGDEWETGWSLYEEDPVEEKIKIELTQAEFDTILNQIKHMRCIVRDSRLFDFENFCNGECGENCNRPDLCDIEGWLRSKIVNE